MIDFLLFFSCDLRKTRVYFNSTSQKRCLMIYQYSTIFVFPSIVFFQVQKSIIISMKPRNIDCMKLLLLAEYFDIPHSNIYIISLKAND